MNAWVSEERISCTHSGYHVMIPGPGNTNVSVTMMQNHKAASEAVEKINRFLSELEVRYDLVQIWEDGVELIVDTEEAA